MLSTRLFSRALPRQSLKFTPLRTNSRISSSSPLRPSWQRPAFKTTYSAFSTSIARREPAGQSDQVLSEKFNYERQLELDSRDTNKVSPTIEDFQQTSGWNVQDKAGSHEVVLTKDFGNEKIRVEFSVTSFQELQEEDEDFNELDEDAGLTDEIAEQSKKTINQPGTKGGNFAQAPEDSIAPADQEGEDSSYPLELRLLINISKPGNKAIEVTALVKDGSIATESVNYLVDSKLMKSKSSEDILKAESLYAGPPFANLDPDLQVMFEQYLEERGIDPNLAAFCSEYVDLKEQREYVGWLKNMKDFIDT